MFTYILIAVAALVAIFLVVVALKPAEFRIARSAAIAAPPEVAFAQVNDFRNWRHWSPWERMDPDLQRTYIGPAVGEGATYSWTGNKQVGAGRMTILESRPHQLIRIQLEFLKPFAATNTAEFTFTSSGDQTFVTWGMTGRSNFCARAFCMFMNMDKMVGGQFDQGLANLNAFVQATPAARV